MAEISGPGVQAVAPRQAWWTEQSQQGWLQCFCEKYVRTVGDLCFFYRAPLSPREGSVQFLLCKQWKERLLVGAYPASLGIEIGLLPVVREAGNRLCSLEVNFQVWRLTT